MAKTDGIAEPPGCDYCGAHTENMIEVFDGASVEDVKAGKKTAGWHRALLCEPCWEAAERWEGPVFEGLTPAST